MAATELFNKLSPGETAGLDSWWQMIFQHLLSPDSLLATMKSNSKACHMLLSTVPATLQLGMRFLNSLAYDQRPEDILKLAGGTWARSACLKLEFGFMDGDDERDIISAATEGIMTMEALDGTLGALDFPTLDQVTKLHIRDADLHLLVPGIAALCPKLKEIFLQQCTLSEGHMLVEQQQHPQVERLCLLDVEVCSDLSAEHVSQLMAALPALKDVAIANTLYMDMAPFSASLTRLAPQIQTLQLPLGGLDTVLATAWDQLVQLTLDEHLNAEQLQLLWRLPQLRDVAVTLIELSEDLSESTACTWRRLVVRHISVTTLAYLPLRSLQPHTGLSIMPAATGMSWFELPEDKSEEGLALAAAAIRNVQSCVERLHWDVDVVHIKNNSVMSFDIDVAADAQHPACTRLLLAALPLLAGLPSRVQLGLKDLLISSTLLTCLMSTLGEQLRQGMVFVNCSWDDEAWVCLGAAVPAGGRVDLICDEPDLGGFTVHQLTSLCCAAVVPWRLSVTCDPPMSLPDDWQDQVQAAGRQAGAAGVSIADVHRTRSVYHVM